MMACYVTLHLQGGNVTARRLNPEGLKLTMRLPLDPEKNTHEADEFLRRAINNAPPLAQRSRSRRLTMSASAIAQTQGHA